MWHRLLIILLFLTLSAPLAQAAPTTPTTDFTDNNNGTVTHKTTGLTWKRCAEGKTWVGSACDGTAKTYTWSQANALTSDGWRLPTIAELETIVERDNINPTINTTIFPNTPTYFWSASAYAGFSGAAWFVDFGSGGFASTDDKSGISSIRLVRGGQSLDSSGLYTPNSDFSDNSDGSVTHKKTNLTWKRCAEGQSWTGSTCTGSTKTYIWSAANALTSGDWRLPNQSELLTIVEWGKYNPAINTAIFPNTPSSNFWSASAHAYYSYDAWGVDFGGGGDYPLGKSYSYSVRLVRGGQSLGTSSTPADCLFNWAEKVYPQYFSPAGGQSQTWDIYYYRQYIRNIYLATSSKDNHVYYLIDGTLGDAGTVSSLYAAAGCQ